MGVNERTGHTTFPTLMQHERKTVNLCSQLPLIKESLHLEMYYDFISPSVRLNYKDKIVLELRQYVRILVHNKEL
jgi:hypothetical protein